MTATIIPFPKAKEIPVRESTEQIDQRIHFLLSRYQKLTIFEQEKQKRTQDWILFLVKERQKISLEGELQVIKLKNGHNLYLQNFPVKDLLVLQKVLNSAELQRLAILKITPTRSARMNLRYHQVTQLSRKR